MVSSVTLSNLWARAFKIHLHLTIWCCMVYVVVKPLLQKQNQSENLWYFVCSVYLSRKQ